MAGVHGVLPPNILKSVQFINASGKVADITVVYKNPRDSTGSKLVTIKVTTSLMPGKSLACPEFQVSMGSYSVVAPVLSVAAGSHKLDTSPKGVVKQHTYTIERSGKVALSKITG